VVTHHIVPRSWDGPDVASNRVVLCPTAHTLVHELLNLYVHHGGRPPWSDRREFPVLIRRLAAKGWDGRPSDKPPYTLAA